MTNKPKGQPNEPPYGRITARLASQKSPVLDVWFTPKMVPKMLAACERLASHLGVDRIRL